MSLVDLLKQCRSLQLAADSKVELALSLAAAQRSPTEQRLRRSSSSVSSAPHDASSPTEKRAALPPELSEWTTSSQQSLTAASEAMLMVVRIAATHVALTPLTVPRECLSLTPDAGFIVMYHHAMECVLQATRVVFDAQLNNRSDDPDASKIPGGAPARCVQCLLDMAERNCQALESIVSTRQCRSGLTSKGSGRPQGVIYFSRTPILLRAWILIAFYSKYDEAAKLIDATCGSSILDEDESTDLPTLGDTLCLSAMASLLMGLPERALPLLSKAQVLSRKLQDSASGWMCSRGRRTHILSLLLRSEARRCLHVKNGSNADWIEDVRTAAKMSRDESRQFSGIPIDLTVRAMRYPPPSRNDFVDVPHNDDEVARDESKFHVLPRLLHRLMHNYCGSLFVSGLSEYAANASVLGIEPDAADQSHHADSLLFWYDVASLFNGRISVPPEAAAARRVGQLHNAMKSSKPRKAMFQCIRHLPELCGPHECFWPHESDESLCCKGERCYHFVIDAEPVGDTSSFQAVFYHVLVGSKEEGAKPLHTAKNSQGSRTGGSGGVGPLFAAAASCAGGSAAGNDNLWGSTESCPPQDQDEGTDELGSSQRKQSFSSSIRSRLFRTGGSKSEVRGPLRSRSGFAFNSSFVMKDNERPARSTSTAQDRQDVGKDEGVTVPPMRKPLSSVFDRLTASTSARGAPSSTPFGHSDSVLMKNHTTPRPLSARAASSSRVAPVAAMSARPTSALQRSATLSSTSLSAMGAESRLANSMRDRINSTR